jgi:P27 family predicted phage terminase small subunit
MVELLLPTGILASIDADALACYCVTYARWVEAVGFIHTDGPITESTRGNETISPWVRIAQDAEKQMIRFLTEFGLTPVSRSKVHVRAEKKDELAEFLASKGK